MVFNIGNSRVIESREVSDGAAIRRRRETPDGKRFTTYERVEKPNLAVIKKNGDRRAKYGNVSGAQLLWRDEHTFRNALLCGVWKENVPLSLFNDKTIGIL